MNHHIALIMGPPSSGKSTSLRNIKEPEGVVYFNFDGKNLPFKSKFKEVYVEDVADIFDYLNQVKDKDEVHTVIIDTLTFMMNQYESQYVVTSTNTMKAWGDYGQFYKQVLHKLKSMDKNIIVLAHEQKVMNETEMVMETNINNEEGTVNEKPNQTDINVHNSAANVNNNPPTNLPSSGPALNLLIIMSLIAGFVLTRKNFKLYKNDN